MAYTNLVISTTSDGESVSRNIGDLSGFSRSINHSFKSNDDRENIKELNSNFDKNGEPSLAYFYDQETGDWKIESNETSHVDQVKERLESDLKEFKEYYPSSSIAQHNHKSYDQYINGNQGTKKNKHIFDETILSYSKEFYEQQGFYKKDGSIDMAKAKEYFQTELANYQKVYKKTTGKDLHICGASLHLDETKPHIHLFTSNIYQTAKGNPTISNPIKDRYQLAKLQDNWEAKAKEVYGDKAIDNHTKKIGTSLYENVPLRELQARTIKQQEIVHKLDDTIAELTSKRDKLDEQINHKQTRINELNDNINEKNKEIDEAKETLTLYENKNLTKFLQHLPFFKKIPDKAIKLQTENIESLNKQAKEVVEKLDKVENELFDKEKYRDDIDKQLKFYDWTKTQKFGDGSKFSDEIDYMWNEYNDHLQKQEQNKQQDDEPREA